MGFPRERIRVLLLQARHPDDPAKAEEVRSFAARCGLEPEQIVSHDLLTGPPPLRRLRQHDAMMVGGSGEFNVSTGDLPRHRETLDLLAEVAATGHPTFASCFGFQCMVEALGGEIVSDADNMEVGTWELKLTEAGREDPLFGQLPESFLAQLGHKERAADHVDGFPTLAFSDRVAVEALRIPGQPVWATQFHPELDRRANLGRYERYLDRYGGMMCPEERQRAVESFRDSPATMDLLERFLRLVFG